MDFEYGKIHGSMLEPVKLATVLGSQMTTSELAAAKCASISDLSLDKLYSHLFLYKLNLIKQPNM